MLFFLLFFFFLNSCSLTLSPGWLSVGALNPGTSWWLLVIFLVITGQKVVEVLA